MKSDVILPERLVSALRTAAFNGPNENGAWALFSSVSIARDPWTREERHRYILREVIPLTDLDVEAASPTHLTVRTAGFMRVLKRAAKYGMTPGFLHGHPSGYDQFSNTDDRNEAHLLRATKNRLGPGSHLISLLALPNGDIRSRVWKSETSFALAPSLVTGTHMSRNEWQIQDRNQALDRQARVFGDQFNQIIQNLRVVVVGAGGTGSPLCVMLARAGVKSLAVIDPDVVEDTNLHRLHGARHSDIGKAKAHCLAAHVSSFGLGGTLLGIQGNIIDVEHQDLLRAADLVFCATDDHAGRMLLNRFAYFYETPVIDLGLAIEKRETERLRDMTGRVSLLYPGAPCLLCRRIIDPRRAREEELLRRDQSQYELQAKQGYVLGGGDPEPAFIAMTTSVACMALEEFTQMLSGYRGNARVVTQRLRRFQVPEDRCSGGAPAEGCPVCEQRHDWGIGDVTPFLDRVA